MKRRLLLGFVFCLGFAFVAAAALHAQAPAKVNVNAATADQLAKVPGMSADMAKAVVDTRAKSGAFKSADDLMRVPGMTKEKADAIAPALSFGQAKSAGDEEETKLPRY
ncbi:MAG TPA: helix-hairpin-helix domain-containing protein [Syntrophorhabdales bacterium]|nr:helix-hairpin-helix domain-containing protein [Syntrophorhabdales bacterium]